MIDISKMEQKQQQEAKSEVKVLSKLKHPSPNSLLFGRPLTTANY